MSANEKNIFKIKHEAILKDIGYGDKSLNLDSLDHIERVKTVKGFLKAITMRVGCNDYLFTLGITELDERFGKSIVPQLWEILDIYCAYSEEINLDISRDDAFSAFYCLVHHYYRQFDTENLKRLLMPKDDLIEKLKENGETAVGLLDFKTVSNSAYNKFFTDYPLIFELLARYYSVLGDYNNQLKMAKTALKKLSATEGKIFNHKNEESYIQQGRNYGIGISCAGAVCSILENNYLYGALSQPPEKGYGERDGIIKSAVMRNLSTDGADISSAFDFIGGESLLQSETYIDDAMNFATNVLGSDYPKYHYLKAKIKFYSAVLSNYFNGGRRLDCKSEIEAEIEKAIELEESRASHDLDKRTYAYNCLKDYVTGYVDSSLDRKYHKDRKDIISASSLDKLNDKAFPALKNNISGDYVFVSYSSANFKPVYCDLLEMDRKGINYWYDKGTCLGVDWKEVVRQRIKGCSVVLYYMNAQSVASSAVMDELNYILQLDKPVICINLCGNSVTSKTLISIVNGGSEAVNGFTSDTFKTVCTACPDYIVMLQRDRDPLNVYHIKKLRADLMKTFPNSIRYVESESALCQSTDKKYTAYDGTVHLRPNEDYLICDKFNKIYIVADGISRSEEEYRLYLNNADSESISGKLSKIFCEKLHGILKEILLNAQGEENLERDFKNAFEFANKEIESFLNARQDYFYTRKYNKVKSYYEKPGCVALAAFIFGNKLYYGSVGDCMGILIRGGRRIIFSDKQTDYAFNQMKIENDRYKLYSEYVNKPENPYGYGVVNGDKNAVKFFAVSRLELETGDEIYLTSDGASDFIKYGGISKISKYSLDAVMKKEDERRSSLGKRNDDKAVIRIRIK